MIIKSISKLLENEIMEEMERVARSTKYGKVLVDYDDCIEIIKQRIKKFNDEIEFNLQVADKVLK